ncbi:MAG: PilZ domain-containing protein [Polyangiaceae bacterium]|nr:PilZ domain-containing protein [Polyangiaceae bacterium]
MGNRDGDDRKRDAAKNAFDLDSSDLNSRLERRSSTRFDVTWSVDCETEETFLYAAITNISELGIFVRTTEPLGTGTQLTLRFVPPDASEPFVLIGTVQWVNMVRPMHDNPNPGMGIKFVNLTLDDRERLVATIRTIAYLRESVACPSGVN